MTSQSAADIVRIELVRSFARGRRSKMAFPDVARVLYRRNPIELAVCQFRFPPILRIDAEIPSQFQERIGDFTHSMNQNRLYRYHSGYRRTLRAFSRKACRSGRDRSGTSSWTPRSSGPSRWIGKAWHLHAPNTNAGSSSRSSSHRHSAPFGNFMLRRSTSVSDCGTAMSSVAARLDWQISRGRIY